MTQSWPLLEGWLGGRWKASIESPKAFIMRFPALLRQLKATKLSKGQKACSGWRRILWAALGRSAC
jgi:hypothetical protein